MMPATLDAVDRRIINALQGGFPLCDSPFDVVAQEIGIDAKALIARIERLLEQGTLSRFGPLYNAERLGGAVTLAAMAVPEERFEAITEIVNSYPEVAHNYRRAHHFNMWFVVASDSAERIAEVLLEIQGDSGLEVMNLPKEEEFFLELKLIA